MLYAVQTIGDLVCIYTRISSEVGGANLDIKLGRWKKKSTFLVAFSTTPLKVKGGAH